MTGPRTVVLIRKACILLLGLALPAIGAERLLPSESPARHLGVKTCAKSACHGADEASPFTAVLQNEYHIWRDEDPHSRSHASLTGKTGRAIAAKLGLKSPERSGECLGCHSDFVPPARRGEQFSLSDGVGCEACHGGAENWIGTHSDGRRKHMENVADGLFPTEDPRERARLCFGCHIGDPERVVTHRLLAAGHPRLSIELDTFTVARPAHHLEDTDYELRKPGANPARTWAIGQAQAAGTWTMLARSGLDAPGHLLPEFSLFECFGCHRSMSKGSPNGGQPRLDVSSLAMLLLLSEQVSPDNAAEIRTRTEALAQARDRESVQRQLGRIHALAGQVVKAGETYLFSTPATRQLLDHVLRGAQGGEYDSHPLAEQATYAAGTLVAALQARQAIEDSPALEKALTALYDEADNAGSFRAPSWKKAAGQLARVLAVP